MSRTTEKDQAPGRVAVSGDARAPAYELDEHLVAIHGEGHARGGEPSVATLEGGEIAIVPADRAPRDAGRVGPVYRVGQGGPLAAPTGRLFVRFAEGSRADQRAADLAAAGFALESVPGYAPHAAWVRPSSGRIVDALVELDVLRRLPGVEGAEPQMVRAAVGRC